MNMELILHKLDLKKKYIYLDEHGTDSTQVRGAKTHLDDFDGESPDPHPDEYDTDDFPMKA